MSKHPSCRKLVDWGVCLTFNVDAFIHVVSLLESRTPPPSRVRPSKGIPSLLTQVRLPTHPQMIRFSLFRTFFSLIEKNGCTYPRTAFQLPLRPLSLVPPRIVPYTDLSVPNLVCPQSSVLVCNRILVTLRYLLKLVSDTCVKVRLFQGDQRPELGGGRRGVTWESIIFSDSRRRLGRRKRERREL